MTATPRQLERTVRLYPWMQALRNAYFWLPVFFLYFSKHLPLDQVLLLESIYYAAVFVLEVPSGWMSDRFGRRPTLIVAGVASAVASGLFALGDGFAWFAPAQVLLAAGMAFTSGTDTALHYDALAELDRADEYDIREARVHHLAALASAIAALGGGVIGMWTLGGAYTLTLIAATGALLVTAAMVEPTHRAEEAVHGPVATVRRCFGILRTSPLRWLFAFAVVAYAMNHVPYHLNQPYVDLLLDDRQPASFEASPLVLGGMTTVIMMLRAVAARASIRLRDRVGLAGLLLGSLVGQIALIAACSAFLHWAVAVALLARSMPAGLQAAPLNVAVVPRLPRAIRATYLSMQSLAGRLSYAVLLFGMALATRGTGDGGLDREGLAAMGWTGVGVGMAALLALLVLLPGRMLAAESAGSREPK